MPLESGAEQRLDYEAARSTRVVGGGGRVALAAEATAEVQLGVPKAETHWRDWQRIPHHHPTSEVCPNLCLWEGPCGETLETVEESDSYTYSESEGPFIPWKNFW